ncbi:ornithine cyclodeaminase family protein [Cystobacter fuscus]|uniref:ornithine cyclodeaminase family protein n=1 Tax=Cystobacter fuscus TaxID=43 RepID=UPI002B29F61B|nr:ornithine cyclodeaminase family protein [Cystobacter fuscus]
MSTLLLSRTDVLRSMDALPLLEDMRAAFRVDAERRLVEPQLLRSSPPGQATLEVSFPGTLSALPACTVKVLSRASGPTASRQGVVHLYELETGALLAIMDAGHLMALRTGVVGALAADVLARPDSSRVALLGAGPAASMQLKSLRLVRSLQHVRVYDEEVARSVDFAARMYQALNLPVRPALSVEEAVEDADIVVISMASPEPLLLPGMLRGGTHVTVLDADAPESVAVSAGLLRQSSFFCDHRELNARQGAPARVGLGADVIQAELGEVLAGQKPGRSDASQVTVFGAVGLPFQDLVAAWHVYQGARGDDSVRRMDFGA